MTNNERHDRRRSGLGADVRGGLVSLVVEVGIIVAGAAMAVGIAVIVLALLG